MFGLSNYNETDSLLTSKLLDQRTFYGVFIQDLRRAQREVIIESPFLSLKRIATLLPTLQMLRRHKVKIIVNTKPIDEQELEYRQQAELCVTALQEVGIEVLYTGGHHRKLAIIDKQILYEGSLNILSQNDSCEVMRRIESRELADHMIDFIGVDKFVE